MNVENERTVFVLLTKSSSFLSRVLSFAFRCEYIHASIGLDEQCNRFFSFNAKKGFCIEVPARKKKDEPCKLYRVRISESSYSEIVSRIQVFVSNPDDYRYSFLGILFCFFKIPIRLEKSYFCSQFVAEVLSSSGAVVLKRKPRVYLPRFFQKERVFELCYEGTIKELAALSCAVCS